MCQTFRYFNFATPAKWERFLKVRLQGQLTKQSDLVKNILLLLNKSGWLM